MLIDWFTIVAQLINFLILVYLLKRVLYKPIVRHMNERVANINNRLQEASDKVAQAEEKEERFHQKELEFEEQKEHLLNQAQDEAQQRKQELIEKAREEVNEKRQTWVETLESDRQAFDRNMKNAASRQVLQIVQRSLQDLADESLINRLAEKMVSRLQNLDQDAREKLERATKSGHIIVLSTCELEESGKGKITEALRQMGIEKVEITYQVDSQFPLGVEASSGNLRFSWGIDSYLEGLRSRVIDLIEGQVQHNNTRPSPEAEETKHA